MAFLFVFVKFSSPTFDYLSTFVARDFLKVCGLMLVSYELLVA